PAAVQPAVLVAAAGRMAIAARPDAPGMVPLVAAGRGGLPGGGAVRLLVERAAATPPALDRVAAAGACGTGMGLGPQAGQRGIGFHHLPPTGTAGTMPRMDDPDLPRCVVNCAAYDRNGVRRDIDLDAISEVLAV